jgi:hypothetical protein
MSLSNKLSIGDVDLKGKRVLIRVSLDWQRRHMFDQLLTFSSTG